MDWWVNGVYIYIYIYLAHDESLNYFEIDNIIPHMMCFVSITWKDRICYTMEIIILELTHLAMPAHNQLASYTHAHL
jgi:hypothetical protein